jgi:hypothetical protein
VVGAIFGTKGRFAALATKPSFAKAISRQTSTLQPSQTRGRKAIGLTLIAIFWNVCLTAMIWSMLRARNAPGWGASLFVIPFFGVGIVLVITALRAVLSLRNPQTTLVVSTPAVAAGDEVTINWSIDGRLERLSNLRIDLEGREEATYRRGTSTYTDRNVFATIPVAAMTPADLSRTGFAKIVVPPGAMHSFASEHNKIIWVLRVRGEIPRWPDCDDEYPLTIAPRTI